MPDLGTAYVQIVPSAKGISGSISNAISGEAGEAGTSAGSLLGGNLVAAISGVIAAAGIGKMIGDAISAGADLEQSIGGIETLFGTNGFGSVEEYAVAYGKTVEEVSERYEMLEQAQALALENANKAYETAGLSANDYMQTVTSFAAALKASTGDELVAAQAADAAVIAMADNANKMGTDMSSIQQAYQGFAKQNYTMLDNLKLGYGGTKTEMERLLKDASKLTGVKYDINNLADVYTAIGVIQDELGITGTTAKEAASTFSGSLNMLKSSWENVLGALTTGVNLDGAIQGLGESLMAFGGNAFRMISTLFSQLPGAISGFITTALPGLLSWGSSIISSIIEGISTGLPNVLSKGKEIIGNITSAIETDLPTILQNGVTVINNFVNGILSAIPEVLSSGGEVAPNFLSSIISAYEQIRAAGMSIVMNLINGIATNLPSIITEGGTLLINLVSGIMQHLPDMISTATSTMSTFITGLMQKFPDIIKAAGDIVSQLVATIGENLPQIMTQGFEMITTLVSGIMENLPAIVTAVVDVIAQFIATVGENLPQILETGITLLGKLVEGIIQAIPEVITGVGQVIQEIWNTFTSIDWKTLGSNILTGIKDGIIGAVSGVIDSAKSAAGSIYDAIAGFFKTGSPSRLMADEIGEMIPAGIALGIERDNSAIDAATDMANSIYGASAIAASNAQPAASTNTVNNTPVSISVQPSPGMDEEALANMVGNVFRNQVIGRSTVYA